MISGVIIVKNEEKNISKCIDSLYWCDEVIVIDDDSTDKTVEAAKKKGARVFTHPVSNNFSEQRNFALEKAKGEWILFIDADEVVSQALGYEITQVISDGVNEINGFFIKRFDELWGKEIKYGDAGGVRLLRLARKNAGRWEGKVHEVWKVKGKTDTLNNSLLHYPHSTITEFLIEINYYTDIRSKELFHKNIKTSAWQILMFPTGKFIVDYFFKKGFLDGERGLVLALIMSLHSFLVRGKLWLLWQKK